MTRTRDATPTPKTTAADRTIESYEAYAATYDKLVGPTLSANIEAALRRLVAVVRPGGEILENGIPAPAARPTSWRTSACGSDAPTPPGRSSDCRPSAASTPSC